MIAYCDRYNVTIYQPKCQLRSRCEGKDCREFCHRCYIFNYLLENSGVGQVYMHGVKMKPDKVDLESFRRLKLIKENIFEWAKSGQNLCIMSLVCGNGKTTWATKMLLNYYAEGSKYGFGFDGLFISVSDLLAEYKNSIGTNDTKILEIEKRLLKANLVVFDDIGTMAYSNFDIEKLFKIINERSNAGLSNIFTTNMSEDILKGNMGNRLFSRVVTKSEVVVFKGKDRRGTTDVWMPSK